MGENANSNSESTPKKSWFKRLSAEYSKIVWPTKETLTKETTAVVIYSAILAVVISVLDAIFQYGISFLSK